jgi:two-component system, OmpR family, sensor histidine kinase KdpD
MKGDIPTLLRLWAEEMRSGIFPYVVAVASVFFMTGIIKLTNADSSMVNIPMLYLLAVQAVAFFLGSRPAVLASIAAFLAFDWFFVTPIYKFTVSDPFELVALMVFLVTAIIIGQLTALFKSRAQDARRREKAATALAQATWTVASEIDTNQALQKVLKHLTYIDSFEVAAVLTRDEDELFLIWSCFPPESVNPSIDQKAAEFVFTNGRPIGWEDNAQWQKALATESGRSDLYLPIMSEEKPLAVLYVELSARKSLSEEERQVLNSMVNHLAVVIQRDRLVRVQALSQALAEADRLKTALLQMVSHDFRSPLASIKGSVSCLFEEDGAVLDTQTRHSLLQAIDAETDRLNKLVGNILDLSRLESGTWKPLCEITPIDELIGATLDSFTTEENKRIEVKLDPNLKSVWVDSVQMVQVLRNLIENALKYSDSKTSVEVKTMKKTDVAVIEVLDQGGGLPKHNEEKIFEPFFRAPEHRESSMPGVGMGLAVSRGLVEAHGGQLKAYNRESHGAIFRVTLPPAPKELVLAEAI